jgi:hypothetical protein
VLRIRNELYRTLVPTSPNIPDQRSDSSPELDFPVDSFKNRYKITYDFDHYFYTKLLSFCPLLVEKPEMDTRYPGSSIVRKGSGSAPATVTDTGAVFHRLVAAPSAAAAVASHSGRVAAVVRWPS